MNTYFLSHCIYSSVLTQKLENYLLSIGTFINIESKDNSFFYEIRTNISKNELVILLNPFIKKLFLCKDERVVLYDTEVLSDILEVPFENEKIILNGDIEKENMVEEIIIELFRYLQLKFIIEDTQNKYFNKPLNK